MTRKAGENWKLCSPVALKQRDASLQTVKPVDYRSIEQETWDMSPLKTSEELYQL